MRAILVRGPFGGIEEHLEVLAAPLTVEKPVIVDGHLVTIELYDLATGPDDLGVCLYTHRHTTKAAA